MLQDPVPEGMHNPDDLHLITRDRLLLQRDDSVQQLQHIRESGLIRCKMEIFQVLVVQDRQDIILIK